MTKDLKIEIDKHSNPDGFIKVTDAPVGALTSEQKVILNRKGNVLFNQGDIESARRIFITTGYSDGLTRVGDTYMQNKQDIKALKLYILAHNQKKTEPVYQKIAGIISILLQEEKSE